jgi:hypothetical protein
VPDFLDLASKKDDKKKEEYETPVKGVIHGDFCSYYCADNVFLSQRPKGYSFPVDDLIKVSCCDKRLSKTRRGGAYFEAGRYCNHYT